MEFQPGDFAQNLEEKALMQGADKRLWLKGQAAAICHNLQMEMVEDGRRRFRVPPPVQPACGGRIQVVGRVCRLQ